MWNSRYTAMQKIALLSGTVLTAVGLRSQIGFVLMAPRVYSTFILPLIDYMKVYTDEGFDKFGLEGKDWTKYTT